MKMMRRVSVVTIIPFSVAPEYRRIADAGTMDPQSWDYNVLRPSTVDSRMSHLLKRASNGRRILSFIGTVSAGKGIDFLMKLARDDSWPNESLLLVIAGRVAEENVDIVEKHQSGNVFFINRFLSDKEIYTLYQHSFFIWSCYRDDYDQASGVFGRAMQSRKLTLVRKDSLISRIAKEYSHPVVDLDFENSSEAVRLIRNGMTITGLDAELKIDTRVWQSDFTDAVERGL